MPVAKLDEEAKVEKPELEEKVDEAKEATEEKK
jgi:hypothetical protein